MKKRFLVLVIATICSLRCGLLSGQTDPSRLQVQVVLVELDVAVIDAKGSYVSGLKPEDFRILEDKLPETIRTFEEGTEAPRVVHSSLPVANAREETTSLAALVKTEPRESATESLKSPAGLNLFILFDTSNYMYRGFVYAQDAINDFVRSLQGVSELALYSYSRNLSRVVSLTSDRSKVLHGVRETVAGDNAALYNSLLLTVKDAAPLSGRKAIVVFSNGPDNASLVPPEDISELAQSTGTIIYMISTRAAQTEPISSTVFERMTRATGGKVYFAKDWQDENQAFTSIRDDLAHLYTMSYYPQLNPNRGFRHITVMLVGKNLQHCHVRTREGYRLLHESEKGIGGLLPLEAPAP